MASYQTVNYALRLKKNIERKLMSEILLELGRYLPLKTYRYVGMGSLWFTDFILFHRLLGIRNMLSIEENAIGYSRAKINKPFGFVTVKQGDISAVLKLQLSAQKRAPIVAWLDHDSNLAKGVIDELIAIAREAREGDILIVTVNASSRQLGAPPQREQDESQQDYENRISDLKKKRFGAIAKGLINVTDLRDLNQLRFPATVAKALIEALNAGCNAAGTGNKFDCLFNFQYADSSPMVTVGGIVQRPSRRAVKLRPIRTQFFFAKGKPQVSIDVPILTYREKARLDRAVGRQPGRTPSHHSLGFQLEPGEARKYIEYYVHYPVFGEISF